MKNTTAYVLIASVAVVITAFFMLIGTPQNLPSIQTHVQENVTNQTLIQDVKKFNSLDELEKFLLYSQTQSQVFNKGGPMRSDVILGEPAVKSAPVPPTGSIPEAGSSTSNNMQYSTTNVQVAGIDEPDFLKNDNKYAYLLSQDKLTIIDVYPGNTAKIISKVGLDVKGDTLQNMFLNKDRLVIFYNDNTERYAIPQYDYIPSPTYTPTTHAVIIDVSDKENPKILKNYEVTGYFTGARMIGDYVYLISNSYVDYVHPYPPILKESSTVAITPDIYYFDNQEPNYSFNTITTFNIFSSQINSKTFMMGDTGTLYVSDNAIYLTYQKYHPYYYDQSYTQDKFFKAILPLLPDDLQTQIKSIWSSNLDPSQKWAQISDAMQNKYNNMSETDKNTLFDKISKTLGEYDVKSEQDYRQTVIEKFAINNGTVSYVTKGEVSGYLLNQYSIDEYEQKLRIATTTEYYRSKGIATSNNVYILDNSLKIVGSIENIASDESIYAARFMGERLYLVTYQRVDPFFVIDLATDTPKILGSLKIPGYSSYLHPYDDNHIIGIGKETKQNEYGGMIPLGVKVALFDVTDVTKPITIDNYTIGGQGTDSDVLNDPKALLFNKEKNILSIPISQQYYGVPIPVEGGDGVSNPASTVGGTNTPEDIVPPRPYLSNNWKGFYIFGVDPSKGITLKGIVEHYNGTNYDYSIGSRSFYIDNSLYTVTPGIMKINDLENIKNEINQITFENTGQIIKYMK